ncbi:MAG TPA: hypothetical protein VJR89_23375 [Polyangiales bacterium]|nr:hypothetical protein [Polyangiales bacterium]
MRARNRPTPVPHRQTQQPLAAELAALQLAAAQQGKPAKQVPAVRRQEQAAVQAKQAPQGAAACPAAVGCRAHARQSTR